MVENEEDQKISVHVSLEFKKIWKDFWILKKSKRRAGKRESQGNYFERAVLNLLKLEDPDIWNQIRSHLCIKSDDESIANDSSRASVTKSRSSKKSIDDESFNAEFEEQRSEIRKLIAHPEDDLSKNDENSSIAKHNSSLA